MLTYEEIASRVRSICQALVSEEREDERGKHQLITYTMRSGRVKGFRAYGPDSEKYELHAYAIAMITWAALVDEGVINPEDRSDEAIKQRGDILKWTNLATITDIWNGARP